MTARHPEIFLVSIILFLFNACTKIANQGFLYRKIRSKINAATSRKYRQHKKARTSEKNKNMSAGEEKLKCATGQPDDNYTMYEHKYSFYE